jgi:hypothetical protein
MKLKFNVAMALMVFLLVLAAGCNNAAKTSTQEAQQAPEATDQRIVAQLYAQSGFEIRFGGEEDIQYGGYISLPKVSSSGACVIIPPFDVVPVAQSKAAQNLIKFFNDQGIATFVYDKPGTGMSKGAYESTPFETEYTNMQRVLDEVIKYREIDRNKIGWYIDGNTVACPAMAAAKLETVAFIVTKNAFYDNYYEAMQHRIKKQVSPSELEMFQALFKAAQQPDKAFYFKKCASLLGTHKAGFFLPAVPDDAYWDLLQAYAGLEAGTYLTASASPTIHFSANDNGQLDMAQALLSNSDVKNNTVFQLSTYELGLNADEMTIAKDWLLSNKIAYIDPNQETKKE